MVLKKFKPKPLKAQPLRPWNCLSRHQHLLQVFPKATAANCMSSPQSGWSRLWMEIDGRMGGLKQETFWCIQVHPQHIWNTNILLNKKHYPDRRLMLETFLRQGSPSWNLENGAESNSCTSDPSLPTIFENISLWWLTLRVPVACLYVFSWQVGWCLLHPHLEQELQQPRGQWEVPPDPKACHGVGLDLRSSEESSR